MGNTAPIYFEDYRPGATARYGEITVTADEIVEFASRYDPQMIHTDPEAAAAGPFGGLIASGWHTASLMMRLFADHYISDVSSLASPGVDELRWVKPVRPGDRLSLDVEVLEARRSRSKPDRGIVRTRVVLVDQDDAPVLTALATNFVRVRDDDRASSGPR
jgi:acyl dehydratase